MKPRAWIVASFFAPLIFAGAYVSADTTFAPQTVAQKTAEAADKTKDAVVKDAKTAVTKTQDGMSKTGEVMTDAWITSRVHERFVGEGLLKNSDISVATDKHVVTLTGTVVGRAGRARAASVALHTEGVRRVVNRLTIGPKPS
jgi:osmotically-inducible protein OsmY